MSKLPWQTDAAPGSFLPREYVKGRQELRFVAMTVSLFVIVMLAVVGAFLVTNQRWTSVRDQQRTIAAEYKSEGAKLKQLESLESQRGVMLSKARITTALLETAPRSVLLSELVTALPLDATLTHVSLESKRIKQAPPQAAASAAKKAKSRSKSKAKKNEETKPPVVLPPRFEYTLKITGVAPTNNDIADYLRKLQDSPLLLRVELTYIEETKLEGLDLRRFEIVSQLPDDADAREVELAEEFAIDVAVVEPQEDLP